MSEAEPQADSPTPTPTPAPPPEPKAYTADAITVTYRTERCLHAAECVRGLPAVFDTAERPWIRPAQAAPDLVAAVIRRCPSGALQYRLAAGPDEQGDVPTTVSRTPSGSIVLRGELEIRTPHGTIAETRAVLCGCGASRNQPYCDHSGTCGT